MKTELRSIFDSAEREDRGLNPEEIARIINNTDRGTEARVEAIAMINGGRASTPEGRAALGTIFEAEAETEAEYAEHRARAEAWEAEIRSIVSSDPNIAAVVAPRSARAPEDDESWRSLMPSLSEYRALAAEGVPSSGGYTVPSGTASKY